MYILGLSPSPPFLPPLPYLTQQFSSHRLAHRQAPRPRPWRALRAHLQKSRAQVLPPVPCTGEEPLRDDEISILNGVLELNTKSVSGIMTPIGDVVTLSLDTILDHPTINFMCVLPLHRSTPERN